MIEKLASIFESVLEVSKDKVTIDTSIENMFEWDSMRHLELILKIEEEFNIKFSTAEIIELNSVAKIVQTLKNKGTQ